MIPNANLYRPLSSLLSLPSLAGVSAKRLAEIDKSLLLHDTALRDIYQKLRPLLEPPPPPPKPEIGFHVKEDAVPYRIKRKAVSL